MERLKKQLVQQRYWEIWNQCQTDPEYAAMLAQMRALEPKFDAAVESLAGEERDVVLDYVNLCEEMSRRMLEFAWEREGC